MKLKSIKYSQFEDQLKAWHLEDCTFDDVNLIVGKNASGKTRTLNVIKNLAKLLCREIEPFLSGTYGVEFQNQIGDIKYNLKISNKTIVNETLFIQNEKKLNRNASGGGQIYFEAEKRFLNFNVPETELTIATRRDKIQHPFFDDLYIWGHSMRHYFFGSELGKPNFGVFLGNNKTGEVNLKETAQVVAIFKRGEIEFGIDFKTQIIDDMAKVGYRISDVGLDQLTSIIFSQDSPPIVALYVKEVDLLGKTDQNEMSQGMFRALSLIIQLNYSLMTSKPSCILIDDIGEGLDFERASNLIKLLIDKAKNTSIQIIMSTNDRFVMNNVPLEYWIVMQRFPQKTKALTYRNSKELFDEFKFTGLNNFDFLSTDFYSKKM